MERTLREFVDSRGVEVRVEREAGIIRGVKILGLRSRNGRSYLPEALAKAAGLYEGAKVNVNHPKGDPTGPRDYQDRIGVIRDVAVRTEGLFADFHFNPKHTLAEQLAWDAEHAPENVGFSHNVQARLARRGDETVVEEILRVESVDLVADPATTRGLFEASGETDDAADLALSTLTVEQLREHRPDLVEQLIAEAAAGRAEELQRLRAELEQLRTAEALRQKQETVRQLLREFDLPDPATGGDWAKTAVSARFLEQLLASPDEPSMRELVQERAALIRASQRGRQAANPAGPLSRDQHEVYAPSDVDAKAFAEGIT
ncbi:MAG: hypothetical protein HUU20_26730 [Pirellulales bacterium]|nr:hypothetical protein [Pirellulales bacterium]